MISFSILVTSDWKDRSCSILVTSDWKDRSFSILVTSDWKDRSFSILSTVDWKNIHGALVWSVLCSSRLHTKLLCVNRLLICSEPCRFLKIVLCVSVCKYKKQIWLF